MNEHPLQWNIWYNDENNRMANETIPQNASIIFHPSGLEFHHWLSTHVSRSNEEDTMGVWVGVRGFLFAFYAGWQRTHGFSSVQYLLHVWENITDNMELSFFFFFFMWLIAFMNGKNSKILNKGFHKI